MKTFGFGRIFRIMIALAFCAMIVLLVALNTRLILPDLKAWLIGETSFSDMTQNVSKDYLVDAFRGKYRLLDLNGLIGRIMGRRAYNDVILLDDGMLARELSGFENEKEYKPLGEALSSFSEYLAKMNIPFVYVQAPYKMDLRGDLLPDGLKDYPNRGADNLMEYLEDEGVMALDLREALTSSIESTERSFYRTDHHWTPDGSMTAFRLTMQFLKERVSPEIKDEYADESRWIRHSLDKWFLGSSGKRVGLLYAGTDPLIWYTPGFDTYMSCEIPKHELLYVGDFSEANIREEYIETRDYYGKNAYCVYIGGDYPLVIHKNPGAENDKRILIIKDSFVLPIQAMLSTEFKEVDVIDPRYYESSLAEYCEENKPDIVLMIINVNSISSDQYADFVLIDE